MIKKIIKKLEVKNFKTLIGRLLSVICKKSVVVLLVKKNFFSHRLFDKLGVILSILNIGKYTRLSKQYEYACRS